eukprot:4921125-Lingulodinium_polyedra.AAC.1
MVAHRDGVLQVCALRAAPPGRLARSSAGGRARPVLSLAAGSESEIGGQGAKARGDAPHIEASTCFEHASSGLHRYLMACTPSRP